MRHKHKKHFSVTLLISLAIHLFVLTVLFTIPNMDEQDGYKKIRVKLGIKNRTSEDGASSAQKYASYTPGAGKSSQAAINGNGIKNLPPIPEISKDIPQPPQSKEDNKKSEAQVKKSDNLPESKGQAPEMQRVIEQAAKQIVVPETPKNQPAPEKKVDNTADNPDEEGTIIGNSVEKNADKLATYEQMLPLWLDKFKQYPEEAQTMHLTGSGEIFIKIDRKGKVLLSKIIKSTGHPTLDKALMKMIAAADPVLPVPLDYHSDKKTFSYKIAFEFKEPQHDQ